MTFASIVRRATSANQHIYTILHLFHPDWGLILDTILIYVNLSSRVSELRNHAPGNFGLTAPAAVRSPALQVCGSIRDECTQHGLLIGRQETCVNQRVCSGGNRRLFLDHAQRTPMRSGLGSTLPGLGVIASTSDEIQPPAPPSCRRARAHAEATGRPT